MTAGRSNPSGDARRHRVEALRVRDGDCCCRCSKPLDFSVTDGQRPDFPTLEHYPIPWRECRSHELHFLKLAHRYCNERADLLDKVERLDASKAALRRFDRNWHKRHPAIMQLLEPEAAIELAWQAHWAARESVEIL